MCYTQKMKIRQQTSGSHVQFINSDIKDKFIGFYANGVAEMVISIYIGDSAIIIHK